MVPALLAESGVVSPHHPLGASTGYMSASRGDWPAMVAEALATSPFAAELAALSEARAARAGGLPGRRARAAVRVPERARAGEAPADAGGRAGAAARRGSPRSWTGSSSTRTRWTTRARTAPLGSCLVLENMDARKPTGRTVAELAPYFAALPDAGFCLDVAHVLSVDPTMEAGERLLDAFAGRLRHLHVSSVDEALPPRAADRRARGALRASCCAAARTCPGSSRRRCPESVGFAADERPRSRSTRRARSSASGPSCRTCSRARARTREAVAARRAALAALAAGPAPPRWCCSARGAAAS